MSLSAQRPDGGLAQSQAAIICGHLAVGQDIEPLALEFVRQSFVQDLVLQHAAGEDDAPDPARGANCRHGFRQTMDQGQMKPGGDAAGVNA